MATKLLAVDVKIVSDRACQNSFDNHPGTSGRYTITSGMLCAGGGQGKDACSVKAYKYLFGKNNDI